MLAQTFHYAPAASRNLLSVLGVAASQPSAFNWSRNSSLFSKIFCKPRLHPRLGQRHVPQATRAAIALKIKRLVDSVTTSTTPAAVFRSSLLSSIAPIRLPNRFKQETKRCRNIQIIVERVLEKFVTELHRRS